MILTDLQRLIAEVHGQADAERRSLGFTLQLMIGNVVLALAPAVPGVDRLFGELTWLHTTGMVVPPNLVVLVNTLIYHRVGSGHGAHRWGEALETVLLYSLSVSLAVFSGFPLSPLWALALTAAPFFGLTKPFRRAFYLSVISGVHGAFALVTAIQGRWDAAAITALVGALSAAIFEVTAWRKRAALLAEADLEGVRARLNQRQLDLKRQAIARRLTADLAVRLSALAERLRAGSEGALSAPARQASIALAELEAISLPSSAPVLPRTLSQLSDLLERKLEPLCVEVRWSLKRSGALEGSVTPAAALAALRIAQELVRNAISHGGARNVEIALAHDGAQVTLSVRDDGEGLAPERLARSTGGLLNARRWSAKQGGSFRKHETDRGTELSVTLPVARSVT
jgi:signal transduction histidine kinase